MKPLIGVILRKGESATKKKIGLIYQDIFTSISNSGGIPLGIDSRYLKDYLNICQGFILEGGDDPDNDNLNIINTLYQENIPLLGICLGMQELGISFSGEYINIPHHLNTYHDILIEKDSLLYKIIKKEKIKVNSRHKSAIANSELKISSKSFDNITESLEDSTKKFFLGVQWHPESTYKTDPNSRAIFNYFFKICKKNPHI